MLFCPSSVPDEFWLESKSSAQLSNKRILINVVYGIVLVLQGLIEDTHTHTRVCERGLGKRSAFEVLLLHFENMCSDRSTEVRVAALLGNYDTDLNQPTNRLTDRPGIREVSLPMI